MATWLPQSTAATIMMGPFLDSGDGNTVEGSLTITQPDIRLSKNGANFAQKSASQTLSHNENGWYSVSLSTTDTNTLGSLIVAIHESGALAVWREFMIVPATVYDAIVNGTGNGVRADARAWNGTAVATPATAGYPAVTVKVGTGTGEINLSSGRAPADVTHFGGSAGTFASGRPETNVNSIANNAITAAAIAADAIGASELAADAVTEIQSGLSTLDAAGVRSAVGLASANLDTQIGDLPTNSELTSALGTLNDLSATEVVTALLSANRRGTAQAGGASTITLDSGASGSDDHYNGAIIVILEGTGSSVPVPRRTRRITDYVGSTKVATVDEAWAVQPDSSTVFIIFGEN